MTGWYIDAISPNGEMDREFYYTLKSTLTYAIEGDQDGAIIGMVKEGKREDSYPVFGRIYKETDNTGRTRWFYKGKKDAKSRSAKYTVSRNGALTPVRAKKTMPFGL